MTLTRILEMIRGDIWGAEEWPVLFASFKQDSAGELHEIEGVRQPITSVAVEEGAKEILLIMDSDSPPLSVARLEEELAVLMSCGSEFTVDCCETPIPMEDGGTIHIDIPVVGAGRDENQHCFLVVYVSKSAD